MAQTRLGVTALWRVDFIIVPNGT